MSDEGWVEKSLETGVLLSALRAFGKGDFSVRLPTAGAGLEGEIALAFNDAADSIERRRADSEQIIAALEEKTERLAQKSLKKSALISAVSQEMRAPLNTLLTVSGKLIGDAEQALLSPTQIAFARIVHSVGTELLSLINDTLELARIQSGGVSLDIEALRFSEIRNYVEKTFRSLAEDKSLAFSVEVSSDLPEMFHTDVRLLQQILTNLLSNAIKFTRQGKIVFCMAPANSWATRYRRLKSNDKVVAITVTDSGIGIPEDKQKGIFDAVERGDGKCCGDNVGSGLGLLISRELTRLLGGEIYVSSTLGQGSTFALYLPLTLAMGAVEGQVPLSPRTLRDGIAGNGLSTPLPISHTARPQVFGATQATWQVPRTVLIVESDAALSSSLLDLVRDNGFSGVVASDAVAAIHLASGMPAAIILDNRLPGGDGWAVLNALKRGSETRQIPVSLISVAKGTAQSLQIGPFGVGSDSLAEKETIASAVGRLGDLVDGASAEKRFVKLLVVDGNDSRCGNVADALRANALDVTVANDSDEAVRNLLGAHFDALLLGPDMCDMSADGLIRRLFEAGALLDMPCVIYQAERAGGHDFGALEYAAENAVLRCMSSPEELLPDLTLFLHRLVGDRPPTGTRPALGRQEKVPELAGLKILIIDDDIRDIFALTGALEQYRMIVFHAENGSEALEILRQEPSMDFVLAELEMSGRSEDETIRLVRDLQAFRQTPIIALTDGALPGYREKCVAAGASDYIAKPINLEQLLSLLRAWSPR